jgi:5-methylcytosine-specific restriction endonuclease McrA
MGVPGKRTIGKGAEYYEYLRSDAWKQVRLRFLKSKLPKDCFVCHLPWCNSFVFHHRTYKNLGCERLMDIVPVCRPCHDKIHALQHGGMDLWAATMKARRKDSFSIRPAS